MIGKVKAFRAHAYVSYLHHLHFCHGLSYSLRGPRSLTHRSLQPSFGTIWHHLLAQTLSPALAQSPLNSCLLVPAKQHAAWDQSVPNTCTRKHGEDAAVPVSKTQLELKTHRKFKTLHANSSKLQRLHRELLPRSGTCQPDAPAHSLLGSCPSASRFVPALSRHSRTLLCLF